MKFSICYISEELEEGVSTTEVRELRKYIGQLENRYYTNIYTFYLNSLSFSTILVFYKSQGK